MTEAASIVRTALRASIIAGELMRDDAMCQVDNLIEALRLLGHDKRSSATQIVLARSLWTEATRMRERFAKPLIADLAAKAAEFEANFPEAAQEPFWVGPVSNQNEKAT